MKRKIVIVIMVLCLVWCIPRKATASVVDSGPAGNDLTWSLTSDGTMTISGTGRMENFNSYTQDNQGKLVFYRYWLNRLNDIKKVVISSGVTSVGDNAFNGAKKLEKIVIADTVTKIGNAAFSNCPRLTDISLGKGVKSTGTGVFSNCDALKSFTFPDYAIDYGNHFISHCDGLEKVTLPSGMTEISDGMFEACGKLKQINIPKTVTQIGSSAFDGTAVKSLVIPDGVQKINTKAFGGCTSLESVTLPAQLKEMGGSVFEGCYSLREVTVPPMVAMMGHTFAGAHGIQMIKFLGHAPICGSELFGNQSVTVLYPSNHKSWSEDYRGEFGENVIWSAYQSNLAPDPVLASGSCGEQLTWKITEENMLVISGQGAMADFPTKAPWYDYGCNIEKIVVEDGVTTIAAYAFWQCADADSICIGETVESIGRSAFEGCAELTELTIPASVNTLADYTFSGAWWLSSITFLGDAPQMGRDIVSHEVTIYCPMNNPTWTDATIYDCDGKITWLPLEQPEHTFTDLVEGKFYYDAVLWAVKEGITKGTSSTTFEPDSPCTRKQIVMFLWRAAGQPEPESMKNPFADVKADQFQKAILWAFYEGITTGTTEGLFSPDMECSRKQIVTFLYRYYDEPELAEEDQINPFSDVKNDRFQKAILWAYYNGITTGKTETTFTPEATCTRAQIVTFLYRGLKK